MYCWSEVFIQNKVAFLSLNIVFVLINCEDQDEMPHYISVFTVCQSTHL